MQEYVAGQDCAIPGVGIVRGGERVTLSDRAAKYLVLKGWLTPEPADAEKAPQPRRRRRG